MNVRKSEPTQDRALREHLLYLLRGGGAHVDFETALQGMRAELRGKKAPGFPHTAWMILEHMRIAQWDILEFSRNAQHVSPDFPAGYWPVSESPSSASEWKQALQAFRSDLQAMQDLVQDEATDLFTRISHGEGQTVLREVLLVADHNAYHLGELVALRRALGAWK